MRKHLLIIALIALIAFIAMPVQAYIVQDTWTTTNIISGSGGKLGATNQSVFCNITKVEYSCSDATNGCVRYWTGTDLSGTEYGHLHAYSDGTTHTGNWVATWSAGSGSVGSGTKFNTTLTYTLELSNQVCNKGAIHNLIHDSGQTYFSNANVAAKYGGVVTGSEYKVGLLSSNVPNIGVGTYTSYYGSATIAPVSSFSCTPTSQTPGSNVVCTDASTNTPTEWFWMEGIDGLSESGWRTSTNQNFTFTETYPALYTVKLKATNSAGSSWYNKTDYISFSPNATPSDSCEEEPAEGYSRTKFRCMNPSNDASVFGCNIQLLDVEGNAWSNQSATYNGIWCIDTLPLHHINAYADATGYTSGSRLGVDEWDNMQYTIPLIPGYVPNASAGKIWVYIYVTDFTYETPVSGALVSISGFNLTTQSATTGSSGAVSLQWPASTTGYINVAKSGYTTGSKVITTPSTGPYIVDLSIHQGIYTATLTPVSTGTVTTTKTIGPYGTPGASGTYAPGYANNQGQIMLDYLATNGLSLVQLCVLVTIMALLGIRLGK